MLRQDIMETGFDKERMNRRFDLSAPGAWPSVPS